MHAVDTRNLLELCERKVKNGDFTWQKHAGVRIVTIGASIFRAETQEARRVPAGEPLYTNGLTTDLEV